ncbi:cell envelope integrity protein TolA [Photorhabdus heterorhabditis]|uniref:Cell division protein FtsX n=1 Tax=Photorhabdus heterorhabditis TaxID=880156 RepID=A0A5B0VSJ7_9GAMM|nr:cell envelope integrity protein TolA [Photorhabdus heterorhabditis]KAA1177636.1 cell envelope integrity protein TolA [Photorhabdus heterorhabditis]KOY60512.1 cell division protein FtsX [Photorhabdus heterorhabditis]MBS9443073.1 cell envelope integrity protein TolA [Photorhabdus heterorhabditis]
MGKTSGQNNKLNRAVIVSVVLHIILIGLLIWGSLTQKTEMGGGGQDGSIIDAVMVDPNAVVQQYNQHQQQQADAKRAEELRKKKAEQQATELREKQAEEQERLKAVEEERIKVQQAAEEQKKQAEEAAKKAREEQKLAEEAAAKAKTEKERLIKEQAEMQKKAEAEAKKEAEAVVAKQKAAEEAKVKAEAEAKAKAEADAKAKAKAEADAKKKAAAQAAKQASEVDDLLGGLTSNTPKQQGGASAAGKGGSKKSGASNADINNYLGQIQIAIQNKFYDADMYRGRTCTLRIKLAPDGLLIDVKPEEGDQALCQAAVAAAKQAKIPKPPSREVYEEFKNAPVHFKPQ